MPNHPHVLLTGIPASGKSTYGRWLQTAKGFLYLDVEHGELESVGLTAEWNSIFAPNGSVDSFVAALSRIKRPVVLDRGFPPHCLPVVESLKHAGIEVWWFDGNRPAARKSFISRGTVSVECLNVQMHGIQRNWSAIKGVVGDRVINTVTAGPTYEDPEITFVRMFPGLVG